MQTIPYKVITKIKTTTKSTFDQQQHLKMKDIYMRRALVLDLHVRRARVICLCLYSRVVHDSGSEQALSAVGIVSFL